MKSDIKPVPSSYYTEKAKKVQFVAPLVKRGEPLASLAQELIIRGFSKRTIQSYLEINKKFLIFLNKSAKAATSQDVKNYLLYLKSQGLSNTSVNLAISGIKFYFEQVLKRKLFFCIKRPKKEKYLPTVLSKNEIISLIEATQNLKHKLLLSIMYGSGLRVSEAVSLKIDHLDIAGSKILVKLGKGAKDRLTLLSQNSINFLRQYLPILPLNQNYLFSGARGQGHLTQRSAEKIFKQALFKAGIKKQASCHSFRHSFATHLLQNGTDIRLIQKLLGHQNIKTTQIYVQVADSMLFKITSPLD